MTEKTPVTFGEKLAQIKLDEDRRRHRLLDQFNSQLSPLVVLTMWVTLFGLFVLLHVHEVDYALKLAIMIAYTVPMMISYGIYRLIDRRLSALVKLQEFEKAA